MKKDIIKRPLKIGINLLYMNRKLSGGSITYGVNLINEIAKADSENRYIVFINKDCTDLFKTLGSNFTIVIIPFSNTTVSVRYFWEQVVFPFYLLKYRLDFLHSLGYVGPLFCPSKHIVSILDLNYKRHAESMGRSKKILLGTMVKLMSIFSNKIITISNFSKDEICEGLNTKSEKVVVTRLSGSDDFYLTKGIDVDVKKIYKIEANYIIAFGSSSSHKNIIGLISAFSKVSKKYPHLSLLLVGHQHSSEELNGHISKLGLIGKVLFTGFVPDDHIFPLLEASDLFVFPSFYEGFGIPLLDAQSTSTPVASSNAASLPEVGDNGALYFNPYNIEEMTSTILKILDSDELRKELVESGLKNRAKYSWRYTALETIACYKP